MKTYKKILCTLLIIVMCLTSVPIDGLVAKATGAIKSNDHYIVLILDASGSMKNEPAKSQKTSAKEFCDTLTKLKSNNYIAIIELNSSAIIRQKFTNDITLLNNAIDKIPSSGGTNINESLELADSLLSNIGNDNCSKSIVLCSDGLPQSGPGSTTGRYTKNDYNNYSYANYVYNTVLKLHNKYSVYTIGFFHSLSGNELAFAKRFMSDTQNTGYYEATNFKELLDSFVVMVDDVSDNSSLTITQNPVIIDADDNSEHIITAAYYNENGIDASKADIKWTTTDKSVVEVLKITNHINSNA